MATAEANARMKKIKAQEEEEARRRGTFEYMIIELGKGGSVPEWRPGSGHPWDAPVEEVLKGMSTVIQMGFSSTRGSEWEFREVAKGEEVRTFLAWFGPREWWILIRK